MKNINVPVEIHLNRTVVRCLSVNVPCSDFGEREWIGECICIEDVILTVMWGNMEDSGGGYIAYV